MCLVMLSKLIFEYITHHIMNELINMVTRIEI